MIAGTTPKPHLRSRPTYDIFIIIRPDTNFLPSRNSAPFQIEMQWQLTSPKMPPSIQIHDQLSLFRDLSLVRLFMHFPASAGQSRLSGPIMTFTFKCQQNHLTLYLLSFYDSLYIFRRDYDKGKQNRRNAHFGL